MFRVNSMGTLR